MWCLAGSIGGVTDSGWMDGTLFLQWLRHFCDTIRCTPQRHHILILDGHHSHKTLEAVLLARERGVIKITIPPHCSHKMQPLDRTFFKSFKAKYNTAADNRMTSHPGQRIDIYAVCGLFDKAYSASACVGKGQKGFKACGQIQPSRTAGRLRRRKVLVNNYNYYYYKASVIVIFIITKPQWIIRGPQH